MNKLKKNVIKNVLIIQNVKLLKKIKKKLEMSIFLEME